MPHKMPTDGETAQVLAVLDWAREHGVAVAGVTVGSCSVTLFEPRGAAADGRREDQPRRGAGIYAELGGEVWKHAVKAGDIEGPGHSSTDGEDLEPAVGVG